MGHFINHDFIDNQARKIKTNKFKKIFNHLNSWFSKHEENESSSDFLEKDFIVGEQLDESDDFIDNFISLDHLPHKDQSKQNIWDDLVDFSNIRTDGINSRHTKYEFKKCFEWKS